MSLLNTLKVVRPQYNYVGFLDACKAFDMISHRKLFGKLIERGVPLYLVMILC